jgi:hypothetical protein
MDAGFMQIAAISKDLDSKRGRTVWSAKTTSASLTCSGKTQPGKTGVLS